MRIIIAGGTGLIGRALTTELIQAGHEVTLLSRSPRPPADLPASVQVAGWDGKTSQGWGHLVEGAGALVNLAGENIAGEAFFPSRWTAERKRRIRQSRLDAGAALVSAVQAAQVKPPLLVQSSAIGFYGPQAPSDGLTLDEYSPAGSDFLADLCQAWEASTAEVEALGVRRVIIRTGVVLSSQGGAFTRLLLPFKFFAGGPLGSGRQVLSWIHLADEAGAIRFLIENPAASGAYNLTAPAPLANAEFAKTIGKVMGRPSFMPVPGFVFKLLFGEVATVVLDGQRVLPQRLQALGYGFKFPAAEPAIRDLLNR